MFPVRARAASTSRCVVLIACACAFVASSARAAPPWVSRGTNLPRYVWAFDPGLGLRYVDYGNDSALGAGLNLEAAVGLLPELELRIE